LTYYVQPAQSKTATGWEIKREDSVKATETGIMPKEEAIDRADIYAENKWIDRGIPTQVMVRKIDGEFQEEATYGDDPERFPG
jgi:hypothetical protein